MKRSVKKEYEQDRKYDFEDFITQRGRQICKKDGHRRLRRMMKGVVLDG